MKRLLILAGFAATMANAQSTNNVQGYIRSDGTYVAPHVRTNPDSNPYNNYSSKPNYNPYTGQSGTVDPYAAPTPPNYGSSYNRRRDPKSIYAPR